MYVDTGTILSAAALLGALVTLLGGLFALYRWYLRQNQQDEDIRAMKHEL